MLPSAQTVETLDRHIRHGLRLGEAQIDADAATAGGVEPQPAPESQTAAGRAEVELEVLAPDVGLCFARDLDAFAVIVIGAGAGWYGIMNPVAASAMYATSGSTTLQIQSEAKGLYPDKLPSMRRSRVAQYSNPATPVLASSTSNETAVCPGMLISAASHSAAADEPTRT